MRKEDTEWLKAAVKELRRLADGGTPGRPDVGICGQILEGETFSRLVFEYAPDWDKYSGYGMFPVPGGYGQYKKDCIENKLWTNPARLELCSYIADKIEEDLEDMSCQNK